MTEHETSPAAEREAKASDHTDETYVLGAVLAQVEDLAPDAAARVLRLALDAIGPRWHDPAADAAAEAWAAAVPAAVIDEIAWNTIHAMGRDGLAVVNFAAMHDVCDPNQYLADATDELMHDELHDGRRTIALANRCTDRFDQIVSDNIR
jgi:hypothetical protein